MTNNEMIDSKSIGEIFNSSDKYCIPYYQRSFAWGHDQITRLLQDIYSSFSNYKNDIDNAAPYFIGSLIVIKNDQAEYEVIDGQQRLTVFSLLYRLLENNSQKCILSYKSRKDENVFLKQYYENPDFYITKNYREENETFIHKNDSFISAIKYLKNSSLIIEETSDKKITLKYLMENDFAEYEKLKEYIKNKVIILRTILPEDTNVASYFEIMNNRGKQLQAEEILKSQIMSHLENNLQQKLFSKIWDACSDMNEPIQKAFSTTERNLFFRESWNDILTEEEFKTYFDSLLVDKQQINDGLSLGDMLKAKDNPFSQESKTVDSEEDFDNENTKYKSIIDFSNFILHVFKVLYGDKNSIVLDERRLLPMYRDVKNPKNPEEFIYNLLFYRTLFDRFVLKTEEIEIIDDDEENFYWRLLQPVKDPYSGKNGNEYYHLRYNTDSEFNDDIYKILSMLQVTFRNRRYKNYLQEILLYLGNEYNKEKSISGIVSEEGKKNYKDKLLQIIENHFISNFYNTNNEYGPIGIKWESILKLGTSTPHFIFNYLELLYWFAKDNKDNEYSNELKEELSFIKADFVYRYYNSVEHHFARNYLNDKKDNYPNIVPEDLDSIGNLCLISKSSNSRLSDVSALEKTKRANETANKGPLRQIIYTKTKKQDQIINNGKKCEWDKSCINTHKDCIKELLENRESVYKFMGVTIPFIPS